MSLKSSFKVNSEKVNQGVWLDMSDHPNADGTIPGFKLARQSMQNKKYRLSVKANTKNKSLKEGDLGDDETSAVLAKIFVESVLLDWRNFQPEDDGVELEFSQTTSLRIFSDPDWQDLYLFISGKSISTELFSAVELEEAVKN